MDEILPNVVDNNNSIDAPIGCSTIIVNEPGNVSLFAASCAINLNWQTFFGQETLGHTEDALSENLNNFYFVSAHIISDEPEGKYKVKEERFTSLCYAGHLPGYTMSYNHHGLVYSINTLSAASLKRAKTRKTMNESFGSVKQTVKLVFPFQPATLSPELCWLPRTSSRLRESSETQVWAPPTGVPSTWRSWSGCDDVIFPENH